LFNVDEKTIRRDIDDIRTYLSNNISTKGIVDVKYRRDQKGYFLTKEDNVNLNKEDVLAIT